MAEGLFEVRNALMLGAYQQCITAAGRLRPSDPAEALERDVLLYRAYVAQKSFRVPLDEIKPTAPPPLLAVRMLADYFANPNKRSKIVEFIEEKTNEGEDLEATFFLMSALIYMKEENFESALRMLNMSEDLEAHALSIQCLLKMDRVDLALKELKRMQEADEDATVTQLAQAWVNMAVGKDKLQDAFYIFQELMDKFGATPLLQVAQSGCLVQQQKYDQADILLQDALQRDASNAEALVNLIVVSQYLGKPAEQCNRYINQLKESHTDHPWVRAYINHEANFDRLLAESEA